MDIEVESVNCDLCDSTDAQLRYKKTDTRYKITDQEFCVVSCNNCGHWYLNPRQTKVALEKCYPPSYYNSRTQDISSQKKRYERQADYFKEQQLGRFLDIGCAGGEFIEIMSALGWDCFGMDLFDNRKENLPTNIDFRFGFLNEIAYPDNFFDGISAWGVFEHLLSPKIYFNEVSRILKPGGRFVILVSNANSLWSRFAYKEDIPRHLHFFTPASIRKYAAITGLKICKIDSTNHIYSRPATGRTGFRTNLLRAAGVPWQDIDKKQTKLHLRLLSILGTFLGYTLIHPRIEELLRLSGMMVVTFTK